MIGSEIKWNLLRQEVLKTNTNKTCDSLRTEIQELHETFSKFIRGEITLIWSYIIKNICIIKQV